MRAWSVARAGGPEMLVRADLPQPVPEAGEVVLEVAAAALNFSDLLMIGGRYQVRPPLPFVPGQEIAGRIAAVGAGSRRGVGERVASKVTWGGFAEYAVARDDMLIPLPAGLSLGDGATLPVVWPTAWLALFERARLVAGETVLVHAAAGGVGSAAVQLACAAGATVIAGVGDDSKRTLAHAAGAAQVVVTAEERWPDAVRALTGGRGPDVVFDPVGGAVAEPSLELLARDGRYLVVGFAGGGVPKFPGHRLLLKNASALGVYWSHEHDGEKIAHAVADILRRHALGQLRIVASRRYAFDALPAALADLAARRTTGKCVLMVGDE
jgi:NADPH2:quinone reductase